MSVAIVTAVAAANAPKGNLAAGVWFIIMLLLTFIWAHYVLDFERTEKQVNLSGGVLLFVGVALVPVCILIFR